MKHIYHACEFTIMNISYQRIDITIILDWCTSWTRLLKLYECNVSLPNFLCSHRSVYALNVSKKMLNQVLLSK